MPLYSATQLLGKSILLNKTIDVYSVFDINNLGDLAKPIGTIKKDQAFILDSFLLPTDGYTNIYGIHYAKRTDLYFTFYSLNNDYLAVKVIGDNRFSLEALKEQGALTVKEEIEKEKYENMSWWEKLMYDIFHGSGLKSVLIIGAVALGAGYLITRQRKK